jgi:hypothetical protein
MPLPLYSQGKYPWYLLDRKAKAGAEKNQAKTSSKEHFSIPSDCE